MIAGGKGHDRSATRVRAPLILVPSSSLAQEDWQTIWLTSDSAHPPNPILDLLLAAVAVESKEVKATKIITASSDSVRAWFEPFIAHHQFRHGLMENADSTRSTLILVRALVSLHCLRQEPWAPRYSGLVVEHVKRLPTADVPPIITVLLEPESRGDWSQPLLPGHFDVVDVGSGWDVPETKGLQNTPPSREGGPPLRRVSAPPEAYSCP